MDKFYWGVAYRGKIILSPIGLYNEQTAKHRAACASGMMNAAPAVVQELSQHEGDYSKGFALEMLVWLSELKNPTGLNHKQMDAALHILMML